MRLLGVLLVLLSLTAVDALRLSEYSVVADVGIDDSVSQNVSFSVFNDGDVAVSAINMSVPEASVVSGALLSNGSLALAEPLAPGGSVRVSLLFSASGLVSSGKYHKVFMSSISLPFSADSFSMKLVLPAGFAFTEVSPQALFSSDGRRIISFWSGESVPAGERLVFSARYEQMFLKQETIVGIPITEWDIVVPGLVFAFLFGYFLAAGAASVLMQKIGVVKARLSGDEAQVVKVLENGAETQADIQKTTGFSKAKLSRLLRGMEERKLISKKTKGRTNLVSLE
ncbi:MAG: hypothetical protein JW834_01745 [Candidatus Diapherotrites archaeon]|nr:hypothetical protein [Candidatus Diapherotrites archaeon]